MLANLMMNGQPRLYLFQPKVIPSLTWLVKERSCPLLAPILLNSIYTVLPYLPECVISLCLLLLM